MKLFYHNQGKFMTVCTLLEMNMKYTFLDWFLSAVISLEKRSGTLMWFILLHVTVFLTNVIHHVIENLSKFFPHSLNLFNKKSLKLFWLSSNRKNKIFRFFIFSSTVTLFRSTYGIPIKFIVGSIHANMKNLERV